MGGSLFFRAFVVHWPGDVLDCYRAGSIPLEFALHVVGCVIDAARGGDSSFMAIPVMAGKGFFLSLLLNEKT